MVLQVQGKDLKSRIPVKLTEKRTFPCCFGTTQGPISVLSFLLGLCIPISHVSTELLWVSACMHKCVIAIAGVVCCWWGQVWHRWGKIHHNSWQQERRASQKRWVCERLFVPVRLSVARCAQCSKIMIIVKTKHQKQSTKIKKNWV